jgi:poly(A) polymerase
VDIDIAVSGSGRAFAAKLGKYFPLKESMDEYRVLYGEFTVDVLGIGRKNIEKDLLRRDFTINGMGLDLLTGDFYDPASGIKDLQAEVVRMISEENIEDDPLRILRGIRIASALHFRIEEKTIEVFRKEASLLEQVKPERIHQELIILFSIPGCGDYLLPEVIDVLFPNFSKLASIPQGKSGAQDVISHSILTVKKVDEIIKNYQETSLAAFWRKIRGYIHKNLAFIKITALIHDIGKYETMKEVKGETHFYGHESIGVSMFRDYGKRLRFSNKEIEYISKLVKNHMWIHLLSKEKESTERAKRRIIFRMGKDLIGLVILTLADAMASSDETTGLEESIHSLLSYYYTSKNSVKQIIRGRDLIKYLKLSPGPHFGQIITRVQAAYEEGEIKTKKEAIALAKMIVKENGKK